MTSRSLYNATRTLMTMLPDRLRRRLQPRLEPILPKPDFYLVSYPKSGRTWLRMMLGTALMHHFRLTHDDPVELEEFSRYTDAIPTIEITHAIQSTNICPEMILFRPSVYGGRQVLFLVRDPRDVLASFYHHQKHRRMYESDMPKFATADQMVDAEVGGLRALLRFYNVWADGLPKTASHLIVHYEDLGNDPASELRRCLDFLDLGAVRDESIQAGVESGRFESMRKAELCGGFHKQAPPPDPRNTSTFKVRKGVVGGYVDDFSPAAIARMDRIIADEMSDLFSRYK